MIRKPEQPDDTGAALVCEHIASGTEPIRVAFRITPVEDADSGWQFFCGVFSDEDPEAARVWSLGDVVGSEPSLTDYLSLPPGTELAREAGVWRIQAGTVE